MLAGEYELGPHGCPYVGGSIYIGHQQYGVRFEKGPDAMGAAARADWVGLKWKLLKFVSTAAESYQSNLHFKLAEAAARYGCLLIPIQLPVWCRPFPSRCFFFLTYLSHVKPLPFGGTNPWS